VEQIVTDAELLKRTANALYRAHHAPRSDVGNPSDAWARHSREFHTLANECIKRGLDAPLEEKPADWP